MLTRTVSILAAAVLAGCANQSILTGEQAARMSALDLCYGAVTYGPISAEVAKQEAQRRGIDCTTLKEAVAARITGSSMPRAAGPNPAANLGQTCRSVMIGNSMQTQCY